MSLTLGLTGMDPATESALKSAFADANARLAGQWRIAPEAEADHVLVDMDSMYGPMSWLRLHAAGKHVIGLTSSARTQTDHRLGRPFDSEQVARLLVDVARQDGIDLVLGSGSPAQPGPPARQAPPPAPPAPAAAAPPPVVAPAAPPTSLRDPDTGAGPTTDAATAPAPARPNAQRPPAEDAVFADWLVPGALARRVRYRRGEGPTLLIDPESQAWHGPTPLKPVAAYFEGPVQAADFEPVDDATWAAEAPAAGPAQPLVRLRWIGGLVSGRGSLLPGNDPDGLYMLNKWPQTEREYPKHFRIATAMMKGPARLPEIAEGSGVPLDEVTDFVNANLATGFAEAVADPALAVVEAPRPTSLLGRLRKR